LKNAKAAKATGSDLPIKLALAALLLFFLPSVLSAETSIPVVIVGADARLQDNIKLTLGDIQAEDLENYYFSSQLPERIGKAIHAMGYYQAKFDYVVEEQPEAGKLIRIKVQAGNAAVWEAPNISVDGEASELKKVGDLVKNTPFIVGTAMTHADYDNYKQLLIDSCIQEGYQNATFTRSELRINAKSNTAKAVITIDSGVRYKIASTSYRGSRLDQDVLDRLAIAASGDWYNRRLVTKQYKTLLDSLYFSSVRIEPTFNHIEGLVTLVIELQDAPRNDILLGAGFATDLGPKLSIRWSKPAVNKKGHSFRSELELTETLQQLTTNYQIPTGRRLDQFMEWGSGIEQKTVEDTESLLFTTGLNFHSSKNNWQQIVGVNIESDHYQQGSESRQATTYFMPTASWSYLKMNSGGNRGHRLWLNTQASTEDLYSDTDFIHILAGAKILLPLTDSHAVIARAEVGAVLSNNFEELPSSKRFFTGGDQTVRGYSFESLAPKNTDGSLKGGDRLTVASLEYRWRFSKRWGLATFVDTGRAYFNSSDSFHTGAGIGIRWFSPLGQLRIDLAHPIDDDEHDGYQLHISMGPAI